MVSRRETWTTEEFGTSHRGAVEAVLPDGSVPAPVYFDSGSGGGGVPVSQWSVYDGPWGISSAPGAPAGGPPTVGSASPSGLAGWGRN